MKWISIHKLSPREGEKVFAYNEMTQLESEQYICGWWYEDENCINTDRECQGFKYAFTHWFRPEPAEQ